MAEELAKEEELVLLCGHYEGIDERVLEEIVTDYVSTNMPEPTVNGRTSISLPQPKQIFHKGNWLPLTSL